MGLAIIAVNDCATHSDVKPLLAHEHMGRRLEQKKNWWWALLSIPPFAGQMPVQIEDYNSSPSFLTKGFFNSKFDKAQICSHSFSVCWRVWKGTHSLHFGLVLPLPWRPVLPNWCLLKEPLRTSAA